MVTFVVIFVVLLCLGLGYSFYGVYTAEEDKLNIEEPFDENSFSKPTGWRVGKMPKSWMATPPVKREKVILQEKSSVKRERDIVWDEPILLKRMKLKPSWLSKSKNPDPMIP